MPFHKAELEVKILKVAELKVALLCHQPEKKICPEL